MKVYFPIQDDIEKNRSEILATIKSIFEKQFLGFKTEPEIPPAEDLGNQFFLKSPHAILWGKIFFDPFTSEKAKELKTAQKNLEEKLQQQIQLNVFFNEREIELENAKDYPVADYFQYSFIQCSGEKDMLVERVSLLKENLLGKAHQGNDSASARTDYSFSKQSQLTRNELAELIDLSLDLKRSPTP